MTSIDRRTRTADVRHQAALSVACLAAFGLLAALLWHAGHPDALDSGTARLADVDPGGFRFRAGEAASFVGSPASVIVAGCLVAAWSAWRARVATALTVLAAPALAGLAEVAAKAMVARPRPVTAALTGESGYGFPSGHVAGLTALVLACYLLGALGRLGGPRAQTASRWALLAVPVVAAARVAVGAHYLTDVLGGLFLGATIAVVLVACLPLTDRVVARALPAPWARRSG